MKDALVTRGVNVRPRKPAFESCPPRGLTVSGRGWMPMVRRGELIDHEFVMGGKRRERERLSARDGARRLASGLDATRAAMYAAQDRVKDLKRRGVSKRSAEFKAAAADARAARAAWLKLSGGVEGRTIELAESSASNKVKAVD